MQQYRPIGSKCKFFLWLIGVIESAPARSSVWDGRRGSLIPKKIKGKSCGLGEQRDERVRRRRRSG